MVRHDYHSCVYWLWRVLPGGGALLSQPHHSRAGAVWLGVDQLSAAAGVKKDQRDPLFEFIGSGADFGRTVRGRRPTNARVDFDSWIIDRDGAGVVCCGYAD